MKSAWMECAKPPKEPKAKASAFADWVFQQSVGRLPRVGERRLQERRRFGRIDHSLIHHFLQHSWAVKCLPKYNPSDWKWLFPTPQDIATGSEVNGGGFTVFTASALSVGKAAMRCIPDAVLKNDNANTYLIIERKTTRRAEPSIPQDGWPNVEAQLWAYSWIDDWADASEVLLVGQLWHHVNDGYKMCGRHFLWKRTDALHQSRCQSWFERYGGQVTAGPLAGQPSGKAGAINGGRI